MLKILTLLKEKITCQRKNNLQVLTQSVAIR